jgi:periplasmic copper chaperone A
MRPGILLMTLLTAAAPCHAEVTAKDAWVRGTVPAQKSTGAFVTLTSTTDAKVVGVSSPIAKAVEIHESMTMGGVNHMHEVESVALPAGRAVQLKPGGHHVMLMGLAKPLKAGESVPLTFTIEEKGGKRRTRLEVKAEVRPLGGG